MAIGTEDVELRERLDERLIENTVAVRVSNVIALGALLNEDVTEATARAKVLRFLSTLESVVKNDG